VEVNVTKVSSHKCFFPTKVLGVGTSLWQSCLLV
jgi:hypothetical protein